MREASFWLIFKLINEYENNKCLTAFCCFLMSFCFLASTPSASVVCDTSLSAFAHTFWLSFTSRSNLSMLPPASYNQVQLMMGQSMLPPASYNQVQLMMGQSMLPPASYNQVQLQFYNPPCQQTHPGQPFVGRRQIVTKQIK